MIYLDSSIVLLLVCARFLYMVNIIYCLAHIIFVHEFAIASEAQYSNKQYKWLIMLE